MVPGSRRMSIDRNNFHSSIVGTAAPAVHNTYTPVTHPLDKSIKQQINQIVCCNQKTKPRALQNHVYTYPYIIPENISAASLYSMRCIRVCVAMCQQNKSQHVRIYVPGINSTGII